MKQTYNIYYLLVWLLVLESYANFVENEVQDYEISLKNRFSQNNKPII